MKLSVNQDDYYHRHLFYADDPSKGNAVTFFEWPDLPRGMVGLGSPHHLSYEVSTVDALLQWKGWLSVNSVPSSGFYSRDGRISLYLRDPDGVLIEIAASPKEEISPDYTSDSKIPEVMEISSGMKLSKFNHASPITRDPMVTSRFVEKALGLKTSFTRANPDDGESSTTGIGNGAHPDFLRYLYSPQTHSGYVGIGNIHHIAMAVEGDEEQLEVLRTLDRIGIRNSGVIDRFWFHSLYFRDPDGNLLEVATKNPGYSVDESPESLGSRLVLPPWLEAKRPEIQGALDEEDRSNPLRWPPRSYPRIPDPPESLAVEVA